MAAAAAAYPPWVILEPSCTVEVAGSGSPSIADANTLASYRTTRGHPISVALCLAAPPEGSRVCVRIPADVEMSYAIVIAAHGDSVVIQVTDIKNRGEFTGKTTDHFIYSAGDAAADPPQPPSLSLLPLPPHFTYKEYSRRPKLHYLHSERTGLLRHGDQGDFVVADLWIDSTLVGDPGKIHREATLRLLRCGCGSGSGDGVWCVKRPVISRYADGERLDDLGSWWQQSSAVIPVGDHRMLCCVNLARGLLFSGDDLSSERPTLRYLPLPEDARFGLRRLGVTADGSTIKLVNVFPRCCCGGKGMSYCRASKHAYVVKTWTLRMDGGGGGGGMAWEMDGRLDATELWALDGYKKAGLPRVELDQPIVSMDTDEPHAICFLVCEKYYEEHGDDTVWRIMVDMKTKTLRSVFRYPKERGSWCCSWEQLLTSRVSRYFNSKPPSTGQPTGPVATAQAEAMSSTNGRIVNNNTNKLHGINNTVQEATILAALREIPGLDRHDLLKAYRILAHDDSGRRFRALMGLPMDLRKECVLMEIKASEACVLCSACSADLLQLK